MHAADVSKGGRAARAVVLSSDEHAAFIRLTRCMRRRVLAHFGLEMAGAHVRMTEDGGAIYWRLL